MSAAAGALALYGQPDLEQKWAFMAPEYGARLENREVYIDPAELLHLMNDDYIDLVSGRIEAGSIADHDQAIEQIRAMRGDGSSTPGSWDGVDRLGSAGMDREGGSI